MRVRFGLSVSSPINAQVVLFEVVLFEVVLFEVVLFEVVLFEVVLFEVLLFDVLPVAVGATRMAPWLRASRSQLHRKPRPLPLPPCSAITSGQARSGV